VFINQTHKVVQVNDYRADHLIGIVPDHTDVLLIYSTIRFSVVRADDRPNDYVIDHIVDNTVDHFVVVVILVALLPRHRF